MKISTTLHKTKDGIIKRNPTKKWKVTPYSQKNYQCDRCGAITKQGTNHYGKIYNLRCSSCSWKNGMQPFVTMTCLKKPPKGVGIPPEWKPAASQKVNPEFAKYMNEYLRSVKQ